MSRRDDSTPLIVLVLTGFVVFALWRFSAWLGASFEVTVHSIVVSVAILAVTVAIVYFLRPAPLLVITGTLAALWPAWMPVADSIAMNGIDPNTLDAFPTFVATPWWDSPWTKWGIEGALVAATLWILFRDHR